MSNPHAVFAPEKSMVLEQRTRVRWFLTFWLFVLTAIAYLDRTDISIAGREIGRDFGLNNQHLGWIFSAFLAGYACFQLPAGVLAAKFGPRRVLTISVCWWSFCTAMTALLPGMIQHSLAVLLGIRIALGAGEAVICPAANQFVARWIPQQERGSVNGIIFAGVGVGSGLTPPLLTWIILGQGWRAAFYFISILGIMAAAVWWALSRDTPADHAGVSRRELREIYEGIAPDSSRGAVAAGVPPIPWTKLLHSRDLGALIMSNFSFGYVAWIFFSWFFLYMVQARGLDAKFGARYAMLPFLSMTVFSLVGGILSDRIAGLYGLRQGRSYLAAISLLLTAIFLVVGSHLQSPEYAAFVLAGGVGVQYLSQSMFWSVSVDIAGRSSAVFASLVNMGGQLGGAVTASLTPWIALQFGWERAFQVAAAFALVGALGWLTVHPERQLQ